MPTDDEWRNAAELMHDEPTVDASIMITSINSPSRLSDASADRPMLSQAITRTEEIRPSVGPSVRRSVVGPHAAPDDGCRRSSKASRHRTAGGPASSTGDDANTGFMQTGQWPRRDVDLWSNTSSPKHKQRSNERTDGRTRTRDWFRHRRAASVSSGDGSRHHQAAGM